MNDGLNLSGHISWILTGKDGSTIKGETPNIITNYGKEWFSNIIAGASPNSLWLGAGESTGPNATVSSSDVKLFKELLSYNRASVSKSNSNNTVVYSAYLAGVTTSVKIRELGLFPNSSIGSTFLIAHQLVGEIPMGPTYADLQVTWIISLN